MEEEEEWGDGDRVRFVAGGEGHDHDDNSDHVYDAAGRYLGRGLTHDHFRDRSRVQRSLTTSLTLTQALRGDHVRGGPALVRDHFRERQEYVGWLWRLGGGGA